MFRWTLGYSTAPADAPKEVIDITPYQTDPDVPGEAQLIWHLAGKLPDYNFGSNCLAYRWCEDVYWHYAADITVEARDGYEPFLQFNYLDYRYTIFINGKTVADGEGMFTPVSVPMSEYVGQTVKLLCLIHPVPKIPNVPVSRTEARESVKPPVSYSWDWHPRLVTSGISGAVTLNYLPTARLTDCEVTYTLSDDLLTADLSAAATVVGPHTDGKVTVRLCDASGEVAAEKELAVTDSSIAVGLTVNAPKLWWCARQGEQNLYTLCMELTVGGRTVSRYSKTVGFRRVRLVMNADGWNAPAPATQATYPFTLELNGRRIFCKGSNFVSADIFYSKITPEVYQNLIELALDANMNIFRMWGGSPVNKDEFFALCDRLGMMVWQEFPLSCNNYPDKPAYLNVLEKEATSIVKSLRNHPSVILWCGGNELFNSWSGMTNQSHALRLLDKITYDNDRNTPFIMTSPLYGVGHGPYVNIVDDSTGKEALTLFEESPRTAYTEFGCPGPASYEYIMQYITKEDADTFFPLHDIDYSVKTTEGLQDLDAKLKSPWFIHHAIKAHYPVDTWFRLKEIYRYFYPTESLAECCELGQIIQGACYKVMFESAHRRWPRSSMTINWCYNEPWPCFANNSLMSYPNQLRPAYFDVKEALRDRLLSVHFKKLRYQAGEKVTFDLWAFNDLPDEMKVGKFTLSLVLDDRDETETQLMTGEFDKVAGTTVAKIGECTVTLPEALTKTFRIVLTAEDSDYSSTYTLFRID